MPDYILAIDPGTERSAYVVYVPEDRSIWAKGILGNEEMLAVVQTWAKSFDDCVLVIEMIASYGMAVGKSVFETCRWIGRFEQRWRDNSDYECHFMFRREAKKRLCNSVSAKDANVRQALMDRYGSERRKAIGTVKAPGPLHGVSKDMWAALAVAVTWAEREEAFA